MNDSGSNTYSERNKGINIAEVLFEEHCNKKQYYFRRIGFDEKNDPIPDFYNLSKIIRNLPDYFINVKGKTALVMVKGTANIKQKEVNILDELESCYSSPQCKLIYCFLFRGKNPIFLSLSKLRELYNASSDKHWNDGVIYRNLNLPNT